MSKAHRLICSLSLLVLLTLSMATPAYAFDGRTGDNLIIKSGEVVNDDLYLTAGTIEMDGTVNGDLVAFGQLVTVNGTVNGDLLTAAQTVVVNGKVTGGIRMAGSVLFIGANASIGGDVLAAGYSLEVRPGSTIGRDAVVGAGQVLLGGDITRNVLAGTGGLEIGGNVGGNVKAEVGEADQSQPVPPTAFMPQSTIPVPIVKAGLTIDPAAKIAGNLQYTQTHDLSFPGGVVSGQVARLEPPVNQNVPVQETAGQKVEKWALNLVRSLVTLILIGLFLLWLFPAFLKGLSDKLQAKPLPSLGWGVISYAGFFFALLVILFVIILGGLVFGFLTLGGLSGTVIWVGILLLFALIVGFILATSFVAKVVVGIVLGRWIFTQAHSSLADHKIWSMVLGVAITVIVIALLSFPLIPGLLGGLLNFVVILFGLGAVWMWASEALARKPVAAAA